MDYIYRLNNLQKIKDIVKKLSCSTHAILLVSSDKVLLNCLATLSVAKDVCSESDSPCLVCKNCKKAIDKNSVDIKFYCENKQLLVEDSTNIVEDSLILPLEYNKKYFIIKNFEDATIQAQNKLLKVIEDPPSFDKFILLSTNLDAILPTIKSRCEVYVIPKLSTSELQQVFDYKLNDAERYLRSMENCDGSLARLEKLYSDNQFLEIYQFALDMLSFMKKSSQILDYSSKILTFKDKFDEFLEVLINLFEDILSIKNNKKDCVCNTNSLSQLIVIASDYSILSVLNILHEINLTYKKLQYNANLNAIVDNLLLKILEIKYICKM